MNPEARAQLRPGFACSYRVLRNVGEVNYIISTSDRRPKTRLCYINALSWVVLGCTLSNAVDKLEDTDHQRQDMVQMSDSFRKLFMYQAVDACDEGVEVMLLQVDDKDFDKTVVYFSKKLVIRRM